MNLWILLPVMLAGCWGEYGLGTDPEDAEICDGIDNDDDGEIDEGFTDDADADGTLDCVDTEECDGIDNDGDGQTDEEFTDDADGDGTLDCVDTEECDGIDNDGDGQTDEGFTADNDGDGLLDCVDTEECDGIDNDGDGQTDEGYSDIDGDSNADCVDDACELLTAHAEARSTDATCAGTQVASTDPWQVAIEWRWGGLEATPEVSTVHSAPVVGRLWDTNGDGSVDGHDDPIVLVNAWEYTGTIPGGLVGLHGESGEEVFTITGVHDKGPALADLDGAPPAEILAVDLDYRLAAFRPDGSRMWTSEPLTLAGMDAPLPVDVNSDGLPEVVIGSYLLDGRTGALLEDLTPIVGGPEGQSESAAADLDGDGLAELILRGVVVAGDRSTTWSTPISALWGPTPAILDVNGDGLGEVAFAVGNEYRAHSTSGVTLQWTTFAGGSSSASGTCVADFDGDGLSEIGIPMGSRLDVRELDGTLRWSAPLVDPTGGLAGCAAYDLNGDGRHELLHADSDTFRIFDGRTGAVLFEDPDHWSCTLREHPTVADIDGDGSVEILVAHGECPGFGSGVTGVTAYGHPDGAWVAGGSGWPISAWTGTNVLEDGTVPAHPEPWWQGDNVYRSGPVWDVDRPDLRIEIIDACFDGCGPFNTVRLSVQVSNHGVADTLDPVPVSVYSQEPDSRFLLSTVHMPPVPAGQALDSVIVEVPVFSIGSLGLTLRVGDPGTGQLPIECDRTNNEVTWFDDRCVP